LFLTSSSSFSPSSPSLCAHSVRVPLPPSCLFFFLLLPPPPTSTLFPYTTLFRSFRGHGVAGDHVAEVEHVLDPLLFFLGDGALLDRKSTRLNFSHVSISYAVFCLKKKIYMPNEYGSLERTTHNQHTIF